MGLFKPDWMSKDESKALRSLNKDTDRRLDVALTKRLISLDVRRAALEGASEERLCRAAGKALLRTCAVVVFAAVFCVSLAACAGRKAGAVDIGWAFFEMPDGYVQVSDLPNHAMISTSADTDPKNFILEERTIQIAPKVRESAWPDALSGMTRQADKYPDKYADVEEMTIGNRQWYISAYTFREEKDSVSGCADITDSRCVVFTAYYMTIDDPDLQKVLETLRIDDSKLP